MEQPAPKPNCTVDGVNALYDIEAVMRRLSVGRSTVFALMASGQLRSVKVGKRRLISEHALCDFINQLDGGAA